MNNAIDINFGILTLVINPLTVICRSGVIMHLALHQTHLHKFLTRFNTQYDYPKLRSPCGKTCVLVCIHATTVLQKVKFNMFDVDCMPFYK